MEILKVAVAYFALVFGAGFALGTIRILWMVPRLGTRMALVDGSTHHAGDHTCNGAVGGSSVGGAARTV